MTTRAQVTQLLSEGHSYETAASELGIAPGEAFLIATGLPADGADDPHPDELAGKPGIPDSPQHLSNPPVFNPTTNATVPGWVRERAGRELTKPQP